MTTVSASAARRVTPQGHVSFVGAGPGDPGLLTLRAVELLRAADVVIADRREEHADLVRQVRATPDGATLPDVEIVDGIVSPEGTPLTAAARARLAVKHARTGARVVRLLAGDPFSDSTGPEEAQACRRSGIEFEVVPGVPTASAVPTYAGVPLTTRTHRAMAVVNVGDAKMDWSVYGTGQTLVLLSKAGRVGEVAAALVTAGRPGTTPVAMTLVGTTTEQSTVVSTWPRSRSSASFSMAGRGFRRSNAPWNAAKERSFRSSGRRATLLGSRLARRIREKRSPGSPKRSEVKAFRRSSAPGMSGMEALVAMARNLSEPSVTPTRSLRRRIRCATSVPVAPV
jgi:siroheme synthase